MLYPSPPPPLNRISRIRDEKIHEIFPSVDWLRLNSFWPGQSERGSQRDSGFYDRAIESPLQPPVFIETPRFTANLREFVSQTTSLAESRNNDTLCIIYSGTIFPNE